MKLSRSSYDKLQKIPKKIQRGLFNKLPIVDNTKPHHICFLGKCGKIPTYGENSLKCCKNWPLPFPYKKEYECISCHAELRAIINYCIILIKKLGNEYCLEKVFSVFSKILLISLALRRNPETNEIDIYPSMPCKVCSIIIQKIGIKKIIYFDINRNYCKTNIDQWITNADISFGMRYKNWQYNMNKLKECKNTILSIYTKNKSDIISIDKKEKNIIICKWSGNIRKMKHNIIINIICKNEIRPVRIQYIKRYNMIPDIFNNKNHSIENSIIIDDLICEMITRKQIVCIAFTKILTKLNEK